MSRWDDVSRDGAAYAASFAALAAAGSDVHGEARLCAALVPAPARVLDAGCGTGRVAIRLTSLGYTCVGVDADPSMLAEASRAAPALRWVLGDLAELELGETFELVVAAGNVIPLVAAESEAAVVRSLAAHLVAGGLLVAGFGLAASHLPLDDAPIDLATYDRLCADAGLRLEQRFATWDCEPYTGGPYAVSVHRR